MGCKKEDIKSLLLSSLITTMLVLAITTPIVTAADDTIIVTFDPEGTVSLAVSPGAANLSTVDSNGEEECVTEFTLYNNGSVAMSTDADTNGTTDGGTLTLDADGAAIPEDGFSIELTNVDFGEGDVFITDGGVTINGSLTPATQSAAFYVSVHLGDISANHSWQTTRINFTGSV